jgi:hypothetical protein
MRGDAARIPLSTHGDEALDDVPPDRHGHTTLDTVRRYVSLAAFETFRRLHDVACPTIWLSGRNG